MADLAEREETRRPGRPSKLTPETQKKICDSVAAGVPFTHACALADVSFQAMRNWMGRAEDDEREDQEMYIEFVDAFQKAVAQCVARNVADIQIAGCGGQLVKRTRMTRPDGSVVEEERWSEKQWTALAWVLERRFPEHFGRRFFQPIAVNPDGSVSTNVDGEGGEGNTYIFNTQVNQQTVLQARALRGLTDEELALVEKIEAKMRAPRVLPSNGDDPS